MTKTKQTLIITGVDHRGQKKVEKIVGFYRVPISCTRRLTFCSGHRVMGHEGKCRNLHGHNYVLEVTAIARQLDGVGRVIDFSVLKEKLGTWIDRFWDHGFIAFTGDARARKAMSYVRGQKIFLLPSNPTAENMALHLITKICPALFDSLGVKVVKVKLWETENCYAEAEA